MKYKPIKHLILQIVDGFKRTNMLDNLLHQEMEEDFFARPFQIDVKRHEPEFRVIELAQGVGKLIKQRGFANAPLAMDHDAVIVEGGNNPL